MANKPLKKFKRELLADKAVREACDEQAPEFAIAQAIIKARHERGLTQEQLALRMNTSQSYIARLENAKTLPTMKTFLRIAEATGMTAQFSLKKA